MLWQFLAKSGIKVNEMIMLLIKKYSIGFLILISLLFVQAGPVLALTTGPPSKAVSPTAGTTSGTQQEPCPAGQTRKYFNSTELSCVPDGSSSSSGNSSDTTPPGSGTGITSPHDEITTPSVQDQAVCKEGETSKQKLSVSVGGSVDVCYARCNYSDSGKGDPKCSSLQSNPIYKYLVAFINILSGGVGIVVIGMIIFRGLQYSWSKDNPQAVAKAIEGIRNAIIALLLFIFSYALLNFLIPGGLIK